MWFLTRTNLVRNRVKFSRRLFKNPNDSKVANRNDFKKTPTKQSLFTNQIALESCTLSTKRLEFDGCPHREPRATSSNCSNVGTRAQTSHRELSHTPTPGTPEFHLVRNHALAQWTGHGNAGIRTWSRWHRPFAYSSGLYTAQGTRSRDTHRYAWRMDGSPWTAPSQDDPSRFCNPAYNPV